MPNRDDPPESFQPMIPRPPIKPFADPAPVGLFSFALTTFVVSCYNAGIFGMKPTDPINVAVTAAVFYGGGAQLLAGMWAYARGEVFPATAFTSYGAFWIAWGFLAIPSFGVSEAYVLANAQHAIHHAKGIFMLGWTIFTVIMLPPCYRITYALFTVFLLAAVDLGILSIADFTQNEDLKRAGGFIGIAAAIDAWYNGLAELLLAQPYPLFTLPLGRYVPPPTSTMSRSRSASVRPHKDIHDDNDPKSCIDDDTYNICNKV